MLLLLLCILLLQLFLKLVVFTIHLVLQGQQMDDVLTFLLGVLLEWMEICLVIFYDDLVHYKFLHVIWGFLTDIDEEDEGFKEVLLLSEVIVILLTGNLERIHGDWPFLGVGDIGSLIVSADSFIGVTCIDQHNVGVLDQ